MATTTRFRKLRTWVQLGFLALWLNPLLYLPQVCGVVFHCHACPLAAFACPVGAMAGAAAWRVFPFAVVGLLLVVAMSMGSLICGWACPFGLLQDLAAKVPTRKLRLPSWMGYGRFLVLAVFVIAVPYLLGEGSRLYVCRLCPAGTLEAAIPYAIEEGTLLSTPRLLVFVPFVVAIFFIRRPWCRVLCPLGGLLALGNRWSLFRVRWDEAACTHCGKCARDCPFGADPTKDLDTSRCIRCLRCADAACGAIAATVRGMATSGEGVKG